MKPTKQELERKIAIGKWKTEVDKLEEPFRTQILSAWDAISAKAAGALVHLPVIDRSPSEIGKPFMRWHKDGHHLAIYFFEDGIYIFCRINGLSSGDEVSIIPDYFLDMIINWKPAKEAVCENASQD